MTKPLFILQSVCRERRLCKECRSVETAAYRDGWAERYRMPQDWPKCPFGISMGFQGEPPAVAAGELAVLAEAPGSAASAEVMARMKARADRVGSVCLHCPGGYFRGVAEDGLTVDCAMGYTCCGGGFSRGYVYLGSGMCHANYWPTDREAAGAVPRSE